MGESDATKRLEAYLRDPEERRRRNEEMIRLLDEWMADESGYDEETWPEIEAALERDRVTFPSRAVPRSTVVGR